MADFKSENDDGNSDEIDNHPVASSIAAIDNASVHRICSGQVILTLATAVKELVENSVDAGATIVDVKLKEHGSEVIEVSDNGAGVNEDNFQGLTLKHHTSKLQDFSDLISVQTFGFRGEALSSLCALGKMNITTRHKDASVATRLVYNHNGHITKKARVARQVGTTVTIENLFYNLPVRHKEFHRNLKKEFAKMIQVLNAYCIVSTGVRVTCTHQTGKGQRSTVIATKGNATLRENIANIFGPKQIQSLLEFQQKQPDEDICTEFSIRTLTDSVFRLEGYVSKCDHGQGRSSVDRQFYFINGRPFDSSKVSKLVNEVYHQYNRHQYPFVVLSITMEKAAVDVNVTPDKRQVFMQEEKTLLATLMASLVAMYSPTTSQLQMQLPMMLQPAVRKQDSFDSTCSASSAQSPRDEITVVMENKPDSVNSYSSNNDTKDANFPTEIDKTPICTDRIKLDSDRSMISEDNLVNQITKISGDNIGDAAIYHGACSVDKEEETMNITSDKGQLTSNVESVNCGGDTLNGIIHHASDIKASARTLNPEMNVPTGSKTTDRVSAKIWRTIIEPGEVPQKSIFRSVVNGSEEQHSEVDSNFKSADYKPCVPLPGSDNDNSIVITHHELDKKQDVRKSERKISFSFESLKNKITEQKRANDCKKTASYRSFQATISPSDNVTAEQELKKEIKKEMFAEMEILGQFNLGFIITKFGRDLFIVDQHATDEKYNFEILQRDTVIRSQQLINPLNLELSASNEVILIDDVEIFKKNGFDFLINENEAPGQRVKLISTPVSKNWNFGKEDIEEMVFVLTDSPGVPCRPSRVRAMFASRACRKSIMIGTALSKQDMRKIVCHMGEIEQPWNCPHGRPTMRHLINLNMLPT